MTDPLQLGLEDVTRRIRDREISAVEYISALLDHIEKVEPRVHSFILVTREKALQRAQTLDEKVKSGGELGALCGAGIAVKDNICVRGVGATCASRILQGYVSTYDATVVERLEAQDAVIVGKTNMDEFAMGSSTEHSCFGPTRNPWDLTRVPGGSSGGSAAAVAAAEAAAALGSDTGGSVRCPASFCSVVGLKPTYGLVSRYGLIAYANSLEQIGPLARSVRDCALLLQAIAGHDARDNTSVKRAAVDYLGQLRLSVEGLRIGVPKEFMGAGVDEDVKKTVWDALDALTTLGASCEEVSLRTLEYALAAYYVIAMSEASSNLARYDGMRYGLRVKDRGLGWNAVFEKNRREGFGQEVKRRIILGTYALSAGYYDKYYLKAQQIRTLLRRDFQEALRRFDVLAGPSMPTPPFKLGEKLDDPLKMYMSDIETVPANLTGLPALSVPCGFVQGLPVGLQMIGRPFEEAVLLRAGHALEQELRLKLTPPL
ncbi:MAG: Asp-tRNA(Asn)/Glu-tRNA(Gln) amidotransferase subunit GatA [Candidatus Bathyarchaeia archaeon]